MTAKASSISPPTSSTTHRPTQMLTMATQRRFSLSLLAVSALATSRLPTLSHGSSPPSQRPRNRVSASSLSQLEWSTQKHPRTTVAAEAAVEAAPVAAAQVAVVQAAAAQAIAAQATTTMTAGLHPQTLNRTTGAPRDMTLMSSAGTSGPVQSSFAISSLTSQLHGHSSE